MADTTHFGWNKPTVGADEDQWGDELNTTLDEIDTDLFVTKTQVPLNEETDSYTLVPEDAGKLIKMTKATANTLTVPPNSSVAFDVGTRIEVLQYGAGQTTIAAGTGVTIRSSGSKLKLRGQYSMAALEKLATDEWVLAGDLTS